MHFNYECGNLKGFQKKKKKEEEKSGKRVVKLVRVGLFKSKVGLMQMICQGPMHWTDTLLV